jgi:hypothetical protein
MKFINITVVILLVILLTIIHCNIRNIELQHTTIDTSSSINLLNHLLTLNNKSYKLNHVKQLVTFVNTERVQLMIQLKEMKHLNELTINHIIPPNTLVVHGMYYYCYYYCYCYC